MSVQIVHKSPQKSIAGMTLIEILVAVLILSIGLLGLVGMQVSGLRANQSAYLKTQASMLAYDMADRMRLNAARAIAGDYNNFNTSNYSGTTPTCSTTTSGCTAANQSALDLAEWTAQINGSGGVALLPNAQGRIIRGAGNLFTIEVRWSEVDWTNPTGRSSTTQTYSTNFSL